MHHWIDEYPDYKIGFSHHLDDNKVLYFSNPKTILVSFRVYNEIQKFFKKRERVKNTNLGKILYDIQSKNF